MGTAQGRLAALIGLLLLSSCAPKAAAVQQPDPITALYLDNGWADSLRVCVQPTIPTWKVNWVCIPLGELRRAVREVTLVQR